MRVLFDTNVVLDFLFRRHPFSTSAAQLVARAENEVIAGFLGATTVTTIYYLAAKELGSTKAASLVGRLLAIFDIAPVLRSTLVSAASSPFSDFEDAVLHEAGMEIGVDGIVSRDPTGFKKARLPVFSPDELLSLLDMDR